MANSTLSRCGIDCARCRHQETDGCPGCAAAEGRMLWGECALAKCTIAKELDHCGQCLEFPCATLSEYALDGDGQRIRNLRALEGVGPGVHISRLNIITSDMAASLAFYKHLGFGFTEENYKSGYVESVAANGLRVSWWARNAMEEFAPNEPVGGYRVEIAVRCPGRQGVDAVYGRIMEAGHKSIQAPFDSPWGQRYAFIEDPDGNLVGLEEHRRPQE